MSKNLSVLVHGVVGWAICGATVAVGRQLVSMQVALLIHAAVAPLAFGLLTWRHARRFPGSSAGRIAVTMVGIVVALDGLLVAPVIERSYSMFRSVIGTWVPFALIGAASYFAARLGGSMRRTPGSARTSAAE